VACMINVVWAAHTWLSYNKCGWMSRREEESVNTLFTSSCLSNHNSTAFWCQR
jgi:hypothetical protein